MEEKDTKIIKKVKVSFLSDKQIRFSKIYDLFTVEDLEKMSQDMWDNNVLEIKEVTSISGVLKHISNGE